jgi:hypothetical protein
MYMYYLLGYRLTKMCEEQIIEALKSGNFDARAAWNATSRDDIYGSDIFKMLNESVYKKVAESCLL